jgi:hypothetical protein
MQKHLLIAGTGRTGTSLLVRILDACGFETEISRRHGAVFWDENANAGIESIPIVGDDHPYVVKSPWSYQFIRELLARPDIKLDGVLLPVRDLAEAAASRVILELRSHYEHNHGYASQVEDTWRDWATTVGGVTYSLEPLDQARILAHSLHRIIESLLDQEIPIHFLKFPRFAEDIEYLYHRLMPVFPNKPSLAEFSERVAPIVDISKIRTVRELSMAQPQNTSARERPISPDAAELPSFETLDQIALKRQLRSTVSALERTQRELSSTVSALERTKAERTELLAMVDRLSNSTSWKLTQPMRTVVDFVRNRK